MPRCNPPICHNCNHKIVGTSTFEAGNDYCDPCFEEVFVSCARCRTRIERDDCIVSASGDAYCLACYTELFFRCRRCGLECPNYSALSEAHSNLYCQECFDSLYISCRECGTRLARASSYNNPDEEPVCRSCYTEYCYTCDDCGRTAWLSDATITENGRYCSRCEQYHLARNWPTGNFNPPTSTYMEIGSERKFGVELETSRCPDHHTLKDNTIWGCVPDCSIEGLEFVSPILYGDAGLREIEGFCRAAEDMGWRCNSSCGYHAHFDVTNETWETLRSIAYAYRKCCRLWCNFVSEARVNNTMCGVPEYSLNDIRRISSQGDWEYFVGCRDRFEFVNWRAYFAHGTLEVRSHDATLDSGLICSWIQAHARFMDYVRDMSLSEIDDLFGSTVYSQLEGFATCVGADLAEFYSNLASDYGKPIRGRQGSSLPAPF